MARVKRKSTEDYSEKDILAVIAAFAADKPITKKKACEMLRIAYNSVRVMKIVNDYTEERVRINRRKREMLKVPISKEDEAYIISAYLSNMNSLRDISDLIYRSTSVIKRTLKKYNIPRLSKGHSYFNPIDLGEESQNMVYKVKDLVYSSRYGCAAEVSKVLPNNVYRLWLFGEDKYGYQPYYELSDLRKAQNYLGISIDAMDKKEINSLIREGIRNANNKNKKR